MDKIKIKNEIGVLFSDHWAEIDQEFFFPNLKDYKLCSIEATIASIDAPEYKNKKVKVQIVVSTRTPMGINFEQPKVFKFNSENSWTVKITHKEGEPYFLVIPKFCVEEIDLKYKTLSLKTSIVPYNIQEDHNMRTFKKIVFFTDVFKLKGNFHIAIN